MCGKDSNSFFLIYSTKGFSHILYLNAKHFFTQKYQIQDRNRIFNNSCFQIPNYSNDHSHPNKQNIHLQNIPSLVNVSCN